MAKLHQNNQTLRFFIGDVRDKDRLHRALTNVDLVVHAAATKIVPTAEYNPFECVKTNVFGAMNLIDASINQNVKKVVALSTDKASSPINLYGATKLASDKLFTASNAYAGERGTKFSVVRYGNVLDSRASVVPLFRELKKTGELPITNFRMTRFFIKLSEAVHMVTTAFREMMGSEIFVKKTPSLYIRELAEVIAPECRLKEVGLRPGEKLHEQLISEDEAIYTYEFKDYYKILSPLNEWSYSKDRLKGGKKVPENFVYTSKNNKKWLEADKISQWLKDV